MIDVDPARGARSGRASPRCGTRRRRSSHGRQAATSGATTQSKREHGPAICRTENVSACYPDVAALVEGVLRRSVEDALGEPVGRVQGQVELQATRWRRVQSASGRGRLSRCQPGAVGAGCRRRVLARVGLPVAGGRRRLRAGHRRPRRGSRRSRRRLTFEPAELQAGDAVCIDGFAPHYSEANRSAAPRRVLVASYAPASEGYSRAAVLRGAPHDDDRRVRAGRPFPHQHAWPTSRATRSLRTRWRRTCARTPDAVKSPGGLPSTPPTTP